MMSQPGFISTLENMDLSSENWTYVFSKHRISVPPMASQQRFMELSDQIEKSRNAAEKSKAQAYETLQSLLCEYIKEA